MFIAWGSSNQFVHLGAAEAQHCSTCGDERPYNLFVQYRVHHLWYVFRWVTQKVYGVECAYCGRTIEVDGEEVERNQPSHPVRFLDRFGWALGVAGIVALLILGFAFDAQNRQLDDTYLAAPQAGDLYEVNLSQMPGQPEGLYDYSLMRVRSVRPEGVEVQFANVSYNKMRGVDRDVSSGAARRDSYYAPETEVIPITQLARMHEDRAIVDVIR